MIVIVEGRLETKVPTIWTDEKPSQEAAPGRNSDVEKVRREEMEKVRRDKIQVREKLGKSQSIVCFQ